MGIALYGWPVAAVGSVSITQCPTTDLPSPAPPRYAENGAAADAIHDVLIVGGGLVGASLAIALDRLGLDVGLVEAAPPGDLPAYSTSATSALPKPPSTPSPRWG